MRHEQPPFSASSERSVRPGPRNQRLVEIAATAPARVTANDSIAEALDAA